MPRSISQIVARYLWSAIVLSVVIFIPSPLCWGQNESPVLARVNFTGPPSALGLPVYALGIDAAGVEYALVLATPFALAQCGHPFSIWDEAPVLERYVSALPMRAEAGISPSEFDVVQEDGVVAWVRIRNPGEVERLSELGYALEGLSREPLVWAEPIDVLPSSVGVSAAFTSNSLVASMISSVRSNQLVSLVRQLTGEEPAAAGGALRMITTRRTSSGAAALTATQFGYEYMRALGLNPSYHYWTNSTPSGNFTNVNVVGTQVGTAASNELVLIVGHLDDAPIGARAPGADDNCSGSVGVLTSASVLSQYRFSRSIRYVLFTGEEQQLSGSAKYAEDASKKGDNIKAVLNLDMIAWDNVGGPTNDLYTHLPNAGAAYTNDLAIATTFTNVVSTYGLSSQLIPRIMATGQGYSDHKSFWDKSYPAILAIEHYNSGSAPNDFTSYYHTTNDTVATLNIPYFTAYTKAAVGTIAHLAQPVGSREFDVVRVISGDWSATNTSFGASVFHAKHAPGALETTDTADLRWADVPANTNASWLKISTTPGADSLATDTRPTRSESIFEGDLSVVGSTVTCTNKLRFVFLTPPDTNRIYTARIALLGAYAGSTNDFLCVTNLNDLVAAGGFLSLPKLINVTNGAIYGYCDIAPRFLDQDPFSIAAQVTSLNATQAILSANAQAGTRIVDVVQISTNLSEWSEALTKTNDIPPTVDNFEDGWEVLDRPVSIASLTNSPGVFFRLRRSWLKP